MERVGSGGRGTSAGELLQSLVVRIFLIVPLEKPMAMREVREVPLLASENASRDATYP